MTLRNILMVTLLGLCLSSPAKDIAEIYGTNVFVSDSVDGKLLAMVNITDKKKFQSDSAYEQIRNAVVAEHIRRLGIKAKPAGLMERKLQFADAVDSRKLMEFRDTVTSQIAVSKLYKQRFGDKAPGETEKAQFVEEMRKTFSYLELSVDNLQVITSQILATPDMGQSMLASVPTDPGVVQEQLFDSLEYGEKVKAFKHAVTSSTVVSEEELAKVKETFLNDPELKAFTSFPDLLKAKALEKKREVVFNRYILSIADKNVRVIDKPAYDELRKRWQAELIDKWTAFNLN